ncbi:hypothetical protein C0995_009046 [Termitomyces sp. Mi166|nr:hypothetical protein C0995_009046 [Termitomyces sp. Mi166\
MLRYDRYWLGRTCWSDVIRSARTIGRLIWFHVPPRLSPKTPQEIESGKVERSSGEMLQVMNEKRMALDLVEGFAVALKHHVRGELGIYYEDLYHLVLPLHPHKHDTEQTVEATTFALTSPQRAYRISAQPRPTTSAPEPTSNSTLQDIDPVIPPINAYGTFQPPCKYCLKRSRSQASALSSGSSNATSSHQALLPSSLPADDTFFGKVSSELIPFSSLLNMLRNYLRPIPLEVYPPNVSLIEQDSSEHHRWQGPVRSSKHRPKIAGNGENLPLGVLRCLSEWLSVLEDRNTVPGTSMGQMLTTISVFEESLSAIEHILTTPLPFVYSVHISTLYGRAYEIQADISALGAVPCGVGITAFIYLGFLAAGEEIEQPFGYDDNDLDLDLFCRAIVHADIEHLKSSPCLNAYFGPSHPIAVHRQSMTLVEISSRYKADADESFETAR